jgi:hypothetical protein
MTGDRPLPWPGKPVIKKYVVDDRDAQPDSFSAVKPM